MIDYIKQYAQEIATFPTEGVRLKDLGRQDIKIYTNGYDKLVFEQYDWDRLHFSPYLVILDEGNAQMSEIHQVRKRYLREFPTFKSTVPEKTVATDVREGQPLTMTV